MARKRPVTLDGAQQHHHAVGVVSLVGDGGHMVDQDLQRLRPHVRVQRPGLAAA